MAKAQEDEAWRPADHFMEKLADCIMDDHRCLRRAAGFGVGETFGSPFKRERIEGFTWIFKVVRAEDGDAASFRLLRDAGDGELQAAE